MEALLVWLSMQAQSVTPHTNEALMTVRPWALALGFFVGFMFHVFMRAAWAVRSTDNPAKSHLDYFKRNWDVLTIRFVLGFFVYWLYYRYPALFTKVVAYVTEVIGVSLNWNLDLPQVPPMAFAIGLSWDVLVDYLLVRIPWLANQIPSLKLNGTPKPPEPPQAKRTGAGGGD